MALIRKCDRCEKVHENYHVDFRYGYGGLTKTLSGSYTARSPRGNVDLFPSCKESFEKWLANEPEKNEPPRSSNGQTQSLLKYQIYLGIRNDKL